MKPLIMMTLIFHSAYTLSDSNIDKRKKNSLDNIDKRINILSETKACISSATTKESIKECKKNGRSNMKALRANNKKMREERKKDRKH